MLIPGDQHWAGTFLTTSVTPYRFYEFMPTPIFIGNRPMPAGTSPEILFKNDTHKVYAVFDVDATVNPARLTVEYFDTSSNASLYRLTITANDILPA